MYFPLVALLLIALTGCGANSNTSNADLTGNGKVTAKLQWPSASASAGKAAAKSTALLANVAKVRLVVTGNGVPTAKTEFPVSSTSGTVEVYPGSELIVAAYGLDASGAVLYEGFATDVTVTSGTTTDVGTIALAPQQVKTADAACVTCHATTIDVTGQNLVVNFKQSGHYANQDWTGSPLAFAGAVPGTGCAGCHGPSHNIPNPFDNGTSSRCFDCHNQGGVNAALVSNHGSWYLNNGTQCSACHQPHNTVAANMERKSWAQSRHGATDFAHIAAGGSGCSTRCHNPNGFIAAVANPSAVVGGTMAPADQMITCNACHSDAARGVLRALPGTKASAYATYTSSIKGYQFAPFQAAFNPNKKAYYPDVAGSNLCIVCHSGTTEGSATSNGLSDPYFVNSPTAALSTVKKGGLITQHNMPSAAVMYAKFGFMNLSTGTNGTTQAYIDSLTTDLDSPTGKITSTHRKFGTSAIAADSHFSPSNPAPDKFKVNGPCAVCHVNGSHSFKIDQAAISNVCNKCHSAENGVAITTIEAFKQYFLEPQQEVYRNAIQLGAAVVNKKVADYNATLTATPNALGYSTANPLQFYVAVTPYTSAQPGKIAIVKFLLTGTGTYNSVTNPFTPYKDDGTVNTASSSPTASNYAAPGTANANYLAAASTSAPYYSTDYTNAAIALGYSAVAGDAGYTKFIGALSNLAFFAKDNGGFAHARTYSRRLIYDSIDFLDDGSLNMTVSQTAKTLSNISGNAVAGLYTKGTAAYNTLNGALTTPASGTSESMLYLIGWSRTSGAWSSPERP
jgi:hypothetical protein